MLSIHFPQISNFAVVEQPLLLLMGLENVLAKPHLHIAVNSPHVETLVERLNLMNFLVKDSTGMAFVVADVVEADVEVITVGLDDVLLLQIVS